MFPQTHHVENVVLLQSKVTDEPHKFKIVLV